MIKAFDKTNLKQLRDDLDAAFAQIRAKHGVVIEVGRISYAADRATTKITMIAATDATSAAPNDPIAAKLAVAQADFKRTAPAFGLKPEQFGTILKHGRSSYKLVGLNTRAGKFPVLGTDVSNGQTYKLPESILASIQSAEYKKLYGIEIASNGTCSNTSAFDAQFNAIGKCNRPATTTRKGFGLHSKTLPYCNECAALHDEAVAEARAEGRAS